MLNKLLNKTAVKYIYSLMTILSVSIILMVVLVILDNSSQANADPQISYCDSDDSYC